MERHVKERLIGATVLVAAAIVLVPEMLSGPKESRRAAATPVSESIKTYSIDLKPVSAPSPPPAPTEETPQESEAPAPAPPEAQPAEPVPAEQTAAANISESPAPQPETAAPEPQPPKSAPKKEASPAANKSASHGGWAIQVGSFSTQAKATSVARDLEKQGFTAFVRSATINGKTLYRVRVGPVAERAAAETMLAKVKVHSAGASIVPL